MLEIKMFEKMKERFMERRKLLRPLLLPLILYIALLAVSIGWLDANPESTWRTVVALIPMLPAVFVTIGVIKAIQQLDEMQRSVLQKGAVFSFVGTLLLMLCFGLLDLAGVEPLNGSIVVLIMLLLWLVGKLWADRKY
jgi:uncharacterized membrane protein (DUF485 family)